MRHRKRPAPDGRTAAAVLLLGMGLAAGALLAGCETNDDVAGGGGGGVGAVHIYPNYLSLSASNTTLVIFRADGGTPPYQWSVLPTNATLMAAIQTNSTMAVYNPAASAYTGGWFLTVTDADGAYDTATIIQGN